MRLNIFMHVYRFYLTFCDSSLFLLFAQFSTVISVFLNIHLRELFYEFMSINTYICIYIHVYVCVCITYCDIHILVPNL